MPPTKPDVCLKRIHRLKAMGVRLVNQIIFRSATVIAWLGIAASVNAHYLWIAVDREADSRTGTNIYFEEAARPGDGFYLDHFLGSSDVWIRTIENPSPDAIKADEVKDGENRWMRVAVPPADEYSVDAYGKFGVYAYGQTNVLLHYYARNLSVQSHDAMHELGRAEQMDLDLVPHDVGELLEFTLLWKGKPVADRMVFVRGPDGLRLNVKTDVDGRIELQRPASGRLTLRSSVEFSTPGKDNGEAYEKIRHNITLVMPIDGTSEGP
ncbi:Nickel uptake substrate-specific transmembrane region [Crateriforma conspicua]|uniref:Nickel uptake substrate-specific transmembrane region n=1 Tax=Crateriforma conspicua TaxID=2527996 RepID=A0A5C6FJM6_9PLAN|nr:Nickel uptake substrate-specific transmembrane region [Crateriforma conspicua]